MDKNTVIGFLLIGVIFFFFYLYNQNNLEQQESQNLLQDSLYEQKIVKKEDPPIEEKLQTPIQETNPAKSNIHSSDTSVIDSLSKDVPKPNYGAFSEAHQGTEQFIIIENDLLKITFSNKGGRIYNAEVKGYETHDSVPIFLFNGEATEFDYQFASAGRIIHSKELFFDGSTTEISSKNGSKSVIYRAYAGSKDKYLEQRYIISNNSYMIGYELNFVGLDQILQKNRNDITLYWTSNIIRQEKSLKPEQRYTTLYYKHADDEVDWLSKSREEDKENIVTPIKWLSYKQQFFNISLISDQGFSSADLSLKMNRDDESSDVLKTFTSELSIPYNHEKLVKFPMSFYIGPNHYNTLKTYDIELERLIPLGWPVVRQINKYVIIFIFNMLNDHIANYGIIILILTLIIKVVLSPLTYKTYLSGAKMKILKPEIDELKKKYPNNQQKVSVEQMKLFRKAGVNPLGGCLPMILQMPVLVAMYYFFPTSIELRQKSFLWANDLSTYDSIYTFADGFSIPFYGDHISLFTLLMCVTTIFYTKMNSQMTGTSAQMGQMKMMTYVMPIMMLFIFNNFSAALTYYYFLTNIISFAQQFIIKKFFINEEEVIKKMKERKTKTKGKSSFQKRLEKIQRQQLESHRKKRK